MFYNLSMAMEEKQGYKKAFESRENLEQEIKEEKARASVSLCS